MLLEFSVEGYKPYKDRQSINLAPLTLIFGPNSGGKSSLIEAIQIFLAELEDPEVIPGIGPIGSPWAILNNTLVKTIQDPDCNFQGRLHTEQGVLNYQRIITGHHHDDIVIVDSRPKLEHRSFYSSGKSEIVNGLWKKCEKEETVVINDKSLNHFMDYSMPKIANDVLGNFDAIEHESTVLEKINKLKSELELLKYSKIDLFNLDTRELSTEVQEYFENAKMLRALFIQAKKNETTGYGDGHKKGELIVERSEFRRGAHFDLLGVYLDIHSDTWSILNYSQEEFDSWRNKLVHEPHLKEEELTAKHFFALISENLGRLPAATFGRTVDSQDLFKCFGLLEDVDVDRQKNVFEFNKEDFSKLNSILADKVQISIATIMNRIPIVPLFRSRLTSVDEPISPKPDSSEARYRFRQLHRTFHNVHLIVGESVRPKPKSWYERNEFMSQFALRSHQYSDRHYSRLLRNAVSDISKDYKILTRGQSNEIQSFDISSGVSQELGLGYQVEFRTAGNPGPINIRHMGAGVSQVLPVFMELHDMRMRDTFRSKNNVLINVFQQPELHLHPRQQANLADIFIEHCFGKDEVSRQIICETHSELMAHRIQKRIRQGRIRPEDVCIVYVNPVNKGSEILRLELNSEGDFIDEWPSGFFDEAFDELFSDDSDQEDES